MSKEIMVEVPYSEWCRMQDRLEWLEALEEAGVDNWEGWGEARKIYKEAKNK